MHPNFSLILDFDSTIIKTESIDCLSKIVLNRTDNDTQILKKINEITNKGMNGEITFENSLNKRLSLLKINKNHIKELSLEVSKNFDDTFINNLVFFESIIDNVYIVSSGFKEVIEFAFKSISNKNWNIFANDLDYRNNHLVSINKNNPLSKDLGKVKLIKSMNLSGNVIVVGDGYTDYEIRRHNQANIFLCYIRNINRKKVSKYADILCYDFNQVKEFINKNYN